MLALLFCILPSIHATNHKSQPNAHNAKHHHKSIKAHVSKPLHHNAKATSMHATHAKVEASTIATASHKYVHHSPKVVAKVHEGKPHQKKVHSAQQKVAHLRGSKSKENHAAVMEVANANSLIEHTPNQAVGTTTASHKYVHHKDRAHVML
jgi:ElaB/YqjD/DUF883 family membrane-anchored ribosome-binding protein